MFLNGIKKEEGFAFFFQTVDKPLNFRNRSLDIVYLLVPLNRDVAFHSKQRMKIPFKFLKIFFINYIAIEDKTSRLTVLATPCSSFVSAISIEAFFTSSLAFPIATG